MHNVQKFAWEKTVQDTSQAVESDSLIAGRVVEPDFLWRVALESYNCDQKSGYNFQLGRSRECNFGWEILLVECIIGQK